MLTAADTPKADAPKEAPKPAAVEGYRDTPIIPGTTWHVHDPDRPQPPVVDPGPGPINPVPAPADAIMLFDGKNLDSWQHGKDKPAQWLVKDGYIEVKPRSGDLFTKESFGSIELHLEWFVHEGMQGKGQGRGNSGIFLNGLYEIQVLDCYNNQTYPDGMTGSLYGMKPPLVNACRPQGQWQVYDIVYHAPKFEGDKVVRPATAKVTLNGHLLQDNSEFLGASGHKTLATYKPHGPGPIKLQDHGNAMRFRNIWIRKLAD